MRFAAIVTAATLTAFAGQVPPAAPSTLIKAARVLDVRAGVYRPNQAVLVSNGRIAAVGALSDIQRRAPADVAVVDLGSATVLPGLVDCHAHVLAAMDGALGPGLNIIAAVTQTGAARRALIGAANARDLLEAGFTTVRNVGHSGIDGDLALRDAIADGSLPGPRILASARKVTPPGGQAVNLRLPDAAAVLDQEFIPISGTTEATRAAATLIGSGVDVIKIVADVNALVMQREEIAAIVAAAHRANVRVAAHATSAAGIQAAIDGGVDTIEHGNDATDAMLQAMREKRIALVPIVWTAEGIRDVFFGHRVMTPDEKAIGEKQIAAFIDSLNAAIQRAVKAGVRIGAGSDMWVRYPGRTRGQATKIMLHALARAGMPPAAVIRAATSDAADVLGWGDRIGAIEQGRFADLIAVQGDPLADIAALDTVTFVMKDGRVVSGSR